MILSLSSLIYILRGIFLCLTSTLARLVRRAWGVFVGLVWLSTLEFDGAPEFRRFLNSLAFWGAFATECDL